MNYIIHPKFQSRAKLKDSSECKYIISLENNVFLSLKINKSVGDEDNNVTSLTMCTGFQLVLVRT